MASTAQASSPPAVAAQSESAVTVDNSLAPSPQVRVGDTLPAAVALDKDAPAAKVQAPIESTAVISPPRQALSVGQGLLGFTFGGESWVEVVDRTGKTVLSKRYKGGEAEEIIGVAPFSIVIGNAHVTRMAYNGKEVDLVPHTRVSVARLTVK